MPRDQQQDIARDAANQALFAFEMDFSDTLRCIPMAVRRKLDLSGIKLTLRQWNRFTREERAALLGLPCETPAEAEAYQAELVRLVRERTSEEAKALPAVIAPDWRRVDRVPAAVEAFARSLGVEPPGAAQWRALSELQRFALLKLTRDNHDNANFLPAMREFGLLAGRRVA